MSSESTPDSETTKRAIEAHYKYKESASTKTAKEYRRYVGRFRDYLAEQEDVTLWGCHSGHAERFYSWMLNEQEYAPSTVRVAHAALMDFYGQMEKFGEDGMRGFPTVSFEVDPTENASPNRIDGMHTSSKKEVEGGDAPLTIAEVRKLVDNVPAPTVRNELIVRLLYQTGIRRSELVRIKLPPKHIDRDKRKIQIYGKKTDSPRKVWYQKSLDQLLNLWINADRNSVLTADESDYLFCTLKSERMSEQTVTDVVTTAAENAGLQKSVYTDKAGHSVNRIGPHTLRKSFGVHFLNDGGDVSYLRKLLGHTRIETTVNHYLKYSDKELEDSVSRHGPHL